MNHGRAFLKIPGVKSILLFISFMVWFSISPFL
jgi:hypothetical protein